MIKKIPGLEVKPVKTADNDRPYPLSSIFDHPYRGMLISAVPNSGKTTLLHNLIRLLISDLDVKKGMFPLEVIVFCGTIEEDLMWKEIFKMLDKGKVEYRKYEDIFEEYEAPSNNNPGRMRFENILKIECEKCEEDKKRFLAIEEAKEKAKDDKKKPVKEEEKPKEYKPLKKVEDCFKVNIPLYGYGSTKPVVIENEDKDEKFVMKQKLFIFDDISTALDNPYLINFIKKARHAYSRVIISTQDFLDISMQFKHCINYFINFHGLTDDRLNFLYRILNPKVSKDEFKRVYKETTPESHDFFFYSKTDPDHYRKGFGEIHSFQKIE